MKKKTKVRRLKKKVVTENSEWTEILEPEKKTGKTPISRQKKKESIKFRCGPFPRC